MNMKPALLRVRPNNESQSKRGAAPFGLAEML
jgi:hypothetical protein